MKFPPNCTHAHTHIYTHTHTLPPTEPLSVAEDKGKKDEKLVRRNGKEEGSQPSGYSPVPRRALLGPLTPLCAFGLKHRGWPGSVSPKVLRISICQALGRVRPRCFGAVRASRGRAGPAPRSARSLGRAAPPSRRGRAWHRGANKGRRGARGAGRGHVTARAPRRGPAAGRGGQPGVPGGFLTEKPWAPRAGCAGPRSAAKRSTCLALRWRSRTSHLQLSLEKHLGRNCVCGEGRGVGRGQAGRLRGAGLWVDGEEVEETAPF